MKQAALSYARKGWAVFPCAAHTLHASDSPTGREIKAKAPLVAHGFRDGSTDTGRVAQWWERYPDAMIGLCLPPHIVVVDIDPHNGGTLEQFASICGGTIPVTRVSHSGRGDGGAHYWFTSAQAPNMTQTNPRDKQGNKLTGIDTRISGKGYVIAPPSLHPDTGKAYWWANNHRIAPMPRALEAAILPPIRPAHATYKRHGTRLYNPLRNPLQNPLRSPLRTPFKPPRDTAHIDGLIRVVATQTQGNRNSALYWAACRVWESYKAGEPIDLENALGGLIAAVIAPDFSEQEAHATIASAYRMVNGGAQ